MDDREELRRLIDVIEKGSGASSFEQAVVDLKTFANTASFLANKLDGRLKAKEAKTKALGPKAPMPVPKPKAKAAKQSQPSEPSNKPVINAISTGISQADFDRLKPQTPQAPISSIAP